MIKHSFKKAEIFHEWIYCTHNEPIYYNGKDYGKSITGIGNYLFAGDKKHLSVESIKENFPRACVAIINRTKKEVVIDKSYICSNDLLMDIPKDYDIFITYKKLEYDSLEDTESKLRNHLSYLIEILYKHGLRCELISINSKALYHGIIEYIYDKDRNGYKTYYGNIINFIDKYKIKKYKFYKENIIKEVDIPRYNGWTKLDSITISCKTPKEIYEKKIFTKKELDSLEKRSFYTKYCYGEGISISDVNKYWDAKFDKELHTKGHFQFKDIIQDDIITWREYIIRRKSATRLWERNYINSLREQVSNSRKEGVIKALSDKGCKSIGEYFRRTGLHYLVVNCKRLINKRNKNELESIRSSIYFYGREQLRLSKDRKYIETSRDCAVPLDNAIHLFRLVRFVYERNKDTETSIDYSNKHIMCGKYQLLKIEFTKIQNDLDIDIDTSIKCLITIGCHTLWYNDVIEFIKYYKLEKDFGIL